MSEKQEILKETEIIITDRTPGISTDLLSCKESIIESCDGGGDAPVGPIYKIPVTAAENMSENDAVCYREAIQSENFGNYADFVNTGETYYTCIPLALGGDYQAIFYQGNDYYEDIACSVKQINGTLGFNHIAGAAVETGNDNYLTGACLYDSDEANGIYKAVFSFAEGSASTSNCSLKTVQIDINAGTVTVLNSLYNSGLLRRGGPISFIETNKLLITGYGNTTGWDSTQWSNIITITSDVPSLSSPTANTNLLRSNFNIAMGDNLALWGDKDSVCLVDTSGATTSLLQTDNITHTGNAYYQNAVHLNNNKALLVIGGGTDMKYRVINIDRTGTPSMTLGAEYINYTADGIYYPIFPTKVNENNAIVLCQGNSVGASQGAELHKVSISGDVVSFGTITEFLPQSEIGSNDRFIATSYILVNGRLSGFYSNYTATTLRYIVYENVDLPGGYFRTDNLDGTKTNFIGFAMETAEPLDPVNLNVSPIFSGISGLLEGRDYFLSGIGGISDTGTVKIGKALNTNNLRIEAN